MTSLLDQLQSSFPSTYALEREVGRGGMATVFLARDVRYDRKVAVKVLSPELGAVLGVERFLSEIRVTATLQHPNLLPLFDSGESNGLLYYVMPFVEGETLRAKLDREKQLSVSETVRLGSAIASALDYAHRNGVIHRDLKPENILLQDGQPLVADFGIALAVSNAGGTRVTQTGLSLGTPQYMSPEQATGDRVIDARSDVYALGAILYECLTGEPPHTGTTAQAIIARLMTEEPRAITASRKNVPAALEDVVLQSLSKLPADRFARADDVAKALQAALTAPAGSTTRTAVAPRPSKSRRLAAGGLACGVVGVSLAGLMYTQSSDSAAVQFAVELPDSVQAIAGVGLSVAISSDGQSVAFLGSSSTDPTRSTGVYVRTLGVLEPKLLPNTTGAANPVFSSDGSTIVYGDNGPELTLKQVSVAGGAATNFARPIGNLLGNAWGHGEFFVYANLNSLIRVSRDGRSSRVIATSKDVAEPIVAFTNPAVLPDGKTVMARAIVRGKGQLAIAPLDSGTLTLLDFEISNVIGYHNGVLFFGRLDGTVNAVPFDLEKRAVLGTPQTVLESVSTRTEGGVNAMLAPNGTLVFLKGDDRKQLIIADASGNVIHTSAEQAFVGEPTWSPDGTRIAAERRLPKSSAVVLSDVWIYDVASTQWTQVTKGLGASPVWYPRSGVLAYQSGPPDVESLVLIQLDGSEKPQPIGTPLDFQPSFMPGGGEMITARLDTIRRRYRLMRVPLKAGGVAVDLLDAGVNGRTPRVSPDGKWVAYITTDEAGTHLFVKSLGASGTQSQVSVAPDADWPRWGKSSSTLYYSSGRTIRRAHLNFSAGAPTVASRDSVMTLPNVSTFDVTPDERRFVYVKNSTRSLRPVIFTRWADSVAAKIKGR